MPTVITVPMLINFPKNSHAYGNLGAYTYSKGKSRYLYSTVDLFLIKKFVHLSLAVTAVQAKTGLK